MPEPEKKEEQQKDNFSESILSDMQNLSIKSANDMMQANKEIMSSFENIMNKINSPELVRILTSEGEEAQSAWAAIYAEADQAYAMVSQLPNLMFGEKQVKNLISKKSQ